MQKLAWNNARFITSCNMPQKYPNVSLNAPYLVFAGRSNVGKSSLINSLCNQRHLVKVSSTPGKTQLLNFFSVDDKLCLVDLPGYGFAKCPEEVKRQWGQSIDHFLTRCKDTLHLIFLLDIRRIPNEEDLQLIEWAHATDTPLTIVLSKADKLSEKERRLQIPQIFAKLGPVVSWILHSSKTKEGLTPLRKHILTTCFGDK